MPPGLLQISCPPSMALQCSDDTAANLIRIASIFFSYDSILWRLRSAVRCPWQNDLTIGTAREHVLASSHKIG